MKDVGKYKKKKVITKQSKEPGYRAALISFFKPGVEKMGSERSFWPRTLIRGLRIKKVVEVCVKKAFLREKTWFYSS